ncbi:MAG: hypothetical protein AAGD13_07870 [Pseudomonadota bacterium]
MSDMTPPEGTGRHAATFPLLAAVTLGSVIFGDYAQDVAKWTVCLHSHFFVGKSCGTTAGPEAVMLGAFVATLVAILGASRAARIGEQTPREARLVMVGALAGSFFALLKAAENETLGYPDPELLLRPIFVYVVTVTVIGFPLLAPGHFAGDRRRMVSFSGLVALTLLLGALAGAFLQGIAEVFWQGTVDRTSARKFVIAPSATVIGSAVFLRIMLHSSIEQRCASWRWLLTWLSLGILIVLVFVLFVYEARHGSGWLKQASLTSGVAKSVLLLWICVLLGATLFAAPLAVLLTFGRSSTRLMTSALIPAALISIAAFQLGRIRIADSHMIESDLTVLVLVHASIPFVSVALVLVIDPIRRWVALRFSA